MKELKFRNDETTKYVEDILDTDLVGILTSLGERVLVMSNGYEFIGLTKKDKNTKSKWGVESKKYYVEKFSPKPKEVLLFENETEMLLWYNS